MLESVIAFVGLLGALVGVGTDSVGLYEKVKPLFKSSGPPILLEFGNVAKRDKEGIEQAYQAIEKIRPRAEGIARKIRNRYFLSVAFIIFAWVGISVAVLSLGIPHAILGPVGVGVFLGLLPVAGFASAKLLGRSFARLPGYRGGRFNGELKFSKVMDTCIGISRESRSRVERNVARSLGIDRLTVSERDLLEQFVSLEAMMSCLESYFLAKRLEASRALLWESFSRHVMHLATSTIRMLVEEGRLAPVHPPEITLETQQRTLREEFDNAGLEDIIDPKIVTQEFFRPDLASLALSSDPRVLEMHFERFWPVRPKT